jgi:hypothetical protein
MVYSLDSYQGMALAMRAKFNKVAGSSFCGHRHSLIAERSQFATANCKLLIANYHRIETHALSPRRR